jgi:SM-20-related protein
MSDSIQVVDDALDSPSHKAVASFLGGLRWSYGAYSGETADSYRYWYNHFAGVARHDYELEGADQFEAELARNAPIIFQMWKGLQQTMLAGHSLVRCYANAYPYGTEGRCHLDSNRSDHFTTIYYPHERWDPDYGGETVFFNADRSDIVAAAYPKPNRLVVFSGRIPHVARGVSRACSVLRTTLMFKTSRLA